MLCELVRMVFGSFFTLIKAGHQVSLLTNNSLINVITLLLSELVTEVEFVNYREYNKLTFIQREEAKFVFKVP